MELKFNKLATYKPEEQNIVFMCGDKEMVVLKQNGDIYVKGSLVENDKEVVDGMREFLLHHKANRSEN